MSLPKLGGPAPLLVSCAPAEDPNHSAFSAKALWHRPCSKRRGGVSIESPRDHTVFAKSWGAEQLPSSGPPGPATAAHAAVAVDANREGIGYLETALELTGEHPEAVSREQVASLRLKLAGLHFIVGER